MNPERKSGRLAAVFGDRLVRSRGGSDDEKRHTISNQESEARPNNDSDMIIEASLIDARERNGEFVLSGQNSEEGEHMELVLDQPQPRTPSNHTPAPSPPLDFAENDPPNVRQARVEERIRTKTRLLEVLSQFVFPDENERQPIVVDTDMFELSFQEQYKILPELASLFKEKGFYLFPTTKKGPTFNYMVGVLSGKYFAFPRRVVNVSKKRLKKVSKSEIYYALTARVNLPLGFGIIDSPCKEELLKALKLIEPNHFFICSPKTTAALQSFGSTTIIPVNCSGFLRFNETRFRMLDEQAERSPSMKKIIKKKKQVGKVLARLGLHMETTRLGIRRILKEINRYALLGITTTDTFDQLQALLGIK